MVEKGQRTEVVPRPAAALRGNSLATVDGGGRLKLPSVFRRALEDNWGSDLYLTSLEGDCLWLYPLTVWRRKEERLLALDRRHRALAKFVARTSYFGAEARLDGQGRVLVPPVLRPLARVAGEVAVLGALDHLEVWNNARFVARLKRDPLSRGDYQALAELGF